MIKAIYMQELGHQLQSWHIMSGNAGFSNHQGFRREMFIGVSMMALKIFEVHSARRWGVCDLSQQGLHSLTPCLSKAWQLDLSLNFNIDSPRMEVWSSYRLVAVGHRHLIQAHSRKKMQMNMKKCKSIRVFSDTLKWKSLMVQPSDPHPSQATSGHAEGLQRSPFGGPSFGPGHENLKAALPKETTGLVSLIMPYHFIVTYYIII